MAINTYSNSVTIASGTAVSGAAQVNGQMIDGLILPAAWTAADITFQVSLDGITYSDLFDGYGNQVAIAAVASRAIALPIGLLRAWDYVKLRSAAVGVPATPENQAADRAIVVVSRNYL